MKVRLIALDVDGTLTDDTHIRISERNKAALRRCAERGIHIVLASGRPMALMRPVAEELGCVRYVISANGGAVWDLKENQRIVSREIPPDISEKIVKILLDYPIATEVYSEGQACVDLNWQLKSYRKQPPAFLELRKRNNRFCEDLHQETAGKPVEKFNVDNMPEDILEKVLKRLQPMRDQLALQFIKCYDNLEINSAKATKGLALEDLCGRLKIPAKAVAAFGDSDNDVSMLSYAGVSYAMRNGEPAAKEAAKYITGANSEDGIAEAIEKWGL